MRKHAIRRRYEDTMLASKPVLYIPMHGATTRELVRQVDVTVANTFSRANGPFRGSQSTRFDATTGSLTLTTDTSYHPGDTLSVGGWFNLTGAGNDTGGIMISAQSGDYTVFLRASDGRVTFRKSGTADIIATSRVFATPWADGWQHILFTKNAGTASVCYLNGISAGGATTNQTLVASASNLTLGRSNATSNEHNGSLAHWAVWSRVLTAGEAADLYRAGVDQV